MTKHNCITTSRLSNWQYTGDVNIAYGGTYLNINSYDFYHGYISACRVTDLDSGCGATGKVLVERIIIHSTTDKARILESLDCLGITTHDLLATPGHLAKMQEIAYALLSYGHYDLDDSWDNYRSYHSEVILQTTDPIDFEEQSKGEWKPDTILPHDDDLREYIEDKYLD